MQNQHELTQAHVRELLTGLRENTLPLWGIMTPQHMVEHLTLSFKSAIGRTKPIVVTSADQIEKLKAQLIGDDRLWERGMKNPFLPANSLAPLKYGSLQEAKEKLITAAGEFEQYYQINPEATPPNPFLGYLDHDDWLRFLYKHVRHHFIQFGLLENAYKNELPN